MANRALNGPRTTGTWRSPCQPHGTGPWPSRPRLCRLGAKPPPTGPPRRRCGRRQGLGGVRLAEWPHDRSARRSGGARQRGAFRAGSAAGRARPLRGTAAVAGRSGLQLCGRGESAWGPHRMPSWSGGAATLPAPASARARPAAAGTALDAQASRGGAGWGGPVRPTQVRSHLRRLAWGSRTPRRLKARPQKRSARSPSAARGKQVLADQVSQTSRARSSVPRRKRVGRLQQWSRTHPMWLVNRCDSPPPGLAVPHYSGFIERRKLRNSSRWAVIVAAGP